MTKEHQKIILEQAAKSGIFPGHCPKCNAELIPSNRIPYAKVQNLEATAISFDCPNSEEHIQPPDLATYYISKGNVISATP